MGVRRLGLLCLLLLWAAASCTGGTHTPVNNNFTHFTAQVLDGAGNPLSGLSVRVNGQDTGVTTSASGSFSLPASAFANGVDATNEILLGRGGVVIGSKDVVPTDDPDPTIRFGDPSSTGTATVSGVAINEISGAKLSGVQVTLFSLSGGVFQQNTGGDGAFSFSNVGAGSWQLVGFLAGYQPEMAFLDVQDSATVDYSLSLTPEGQVRPGEGVKVHGTLKDSKTGQPIAGAFVSMMADTGYMGVATPGVYNDVTSGGAGSGGGGSTDPSTGAVGSGVAEPGFTGPGAPDMPPPPDPNGKPGNGFFAPWRYDPQYQETTTGADGTFEFTDAVVGYSLWFNFHADGYLAGSSYQALDGTNKDLNVDLTLDPIVPTDITGVVKDSKTGQPIEGASVEFIFSGNNGGGPPPMPMPPMMDLGGYAADGTNVKDGVGAPPPPRAPGTNGAESGGGGWNDWANSPAADASGGNDSGAGAPGGGMDSQLMEKYRWEQQHGHGTSDVAKPDFEGYLSFTTGVDGTYHFDQVPAGPYYVIVSAYKHLPYNNNFTATEAGPNAVNVDLDPIPVGSVEGDVTDENGQPLPDVLVNATQPYIDPFAFTDSAGHFRIDNVPTGTWVISGYKEGYLTVSQNAEITDGGVEHVSLTLKTYTPPQATLIPFTGHILDGTKFDANGKPTSDAGITGASVVFTPVKDEYGSYAQHTTTDTQGNYGVSLINNLDYNLLIQADGFQDLYTRIYVDDSWPMFDYSIWPVGSNGWGGGVVVPGRPTDPATGKEGNGGPPSK